MNIVVQPTDIEYHYFRIEIYALFKDINSFANKMNITILKSLKYNIGESRSCGMDYKNLFRTYM